MIVVDESVLQHAHITKTIIKNLKTTNNDCRGSCLKLQLASDYLSIACLFTPSSPLIQAVGVCAVRKFGFFCSYRVTTISLLINLSLSLIVQIPNHFLRLRFLKVGGRCSKLIKRVQAL